MRRRPQNLITGMCAIIVLICLCLSPMLGQDDTLWHFDGSASSSAGNSAIDQDTESASDNPDQANAIRKMRKNLLRSMPDSPFDFLNGVGEAVAGAAEGAAGAISDAAESAGQALEDWQKEQEEAAKARALEELKKAELAPKTKTLEYSNKETDPLTLVNCSNPRIKVTSKDMVNLTKPGTMKIGYTLSLEGQSAQRTISFMVSDTKKPEIQFAKRRVEVALGEGFDPVSNIKSVSDSVDGDLPRVDAPPETQATKVGAERFYDKGWYTVEGGIDPQTPGTYVIAVNAADVNGNVQQSTFEVSVVEPVVAEPVPATRHYILNTNTHKFHIQGCSAVSRMKDSNRWDVEMTRDEVLGMGYSPCGICHP